MCGIAGIIYSSSRAADINFFRDRLHAMTLSLQHRGPDGESVWINPACIAGLGHRRLSIIDLSDAGAQPLHYLDRYTIVHNGEIYNYLELRSELEAKGYRFRTATDTEIILAAYDYWGGDCVDAFDGMFAFAIWDEKEKKLFAARDRFGEKPFFYTLDDEQFVFGSEIKALWAAGIPKKPNTKMLFNFITIGYTDNPAQPEETFFENIYKLPPATSLIYDSVTKNLVLEKYWDIDPEKMDKPISDTMALEKFSDLLAVSVKRRLRSDVALGASLSGGIDSSSILAAISRLQNGLPGTPALEKVFTAIFPGYEKDEAALSGKAADHFGLPQITVSLTADDLLNDWEKLVWHQEEPFGSASVFIQYKVFEQARQQNIKVLLDGQGADETMAGYTKYYKWYWQELFQKRKLLRSHELKAARQLGIKETFGAKNIIAALFPDIASVILERQWLVKALKQEDLNRDFIRFQSQEAYYTTPVNFSLNGALYFNTCMHGLEELLRYADRNSMAHGREVRLPYLSHELVEFIFSLPADFKIRKGWTKWLLRETMKDQLPGEIVWRKEKVGFEPPQKDWMQHAALQELMMEAKKKLVKENILTPQSLSKKIRPQGAHETDNYDWRYLSASTMFT